MKKPDLVVLGASGGVAAAFLHHMPAFRQLFGSLVLVDRHDAVRRNPFVAHDLLQYRFRKFDVDPQRKRASYVSMLRKERADIVLDLTDCDTIPLLEATDEAGVSFLTAGINAEGPTHAAVDALWKTRKSYRRAAHVVCSGMNPGCVNAWTRHAVRKHGVPDEITHFEYDTSQMTKRWHPMITWSIKEFLEEAVSDAGGYTMGRYRPHELFPNALVHRKRMRSVLKPVLPLAEYPEGFLMFHEECSSLSNMYDVPSRFLYAIHPKTMRTMIELYETRGEVRASDLKIVDNTEDVLEGSDTIGVRLDYPKKAVYLVNSFPNGPVIGTNATYTQVVIGVYAGLFCLRRREVGLGAHFPEELDKTVYPDIVFDNMRVQEFVFRKRGSRLQLMSHSPRIAPRKTHLKRRYII